MTAATLKEKRCHKIRFSDATTNQEEKQMTEALKDGHNMRLALRTLQSGLSTYSEVYKALESKYTPFHIAEFRGAFYGN